MVPRQCLHCRNGDRQSHRGKRQFSSVIIQFPLHQFTQNLAHVIMSVILPFTPQFIQIDSAAAFRKYTVLKRTPRLPTLCLKNDSAER